jgi:hypothetical protein
MSRRRLVLIVLAVAVPAAPLWLGYFGPRNPWLVTEHGSGP